MEHKYTNRLINEKSPYLLQHAHNPVDWYSWGDEAFEKAKREDKPVFLSIGYSTCHWCHVMERESFESEEVARALNEGFVAIKVDREERPDIDQVYMAVAQSLTGSGGWPLTVFLTPDRKPFYAGTYFPKESRQGLPGLLDILELFRKKWLTERQAFDMAGEDIKDGLQSSFQRLKPGDPGAELLDRAFEQLSGRFDPKYGGFGNAPKFPSPHQLLFLLRYWKRTGDQRPLELVETTLQAMYCGGIYDHVGFGFSRYSTDRYWLAPHFEKMLYDNALLAIAYLEAYQATRNSFYAGVARNILSYVLRDMTSPDGVFYSAEDADSEGEEGRFYLWTPEQVKQALGDEQGEFFNYFYDITDAGNFEGRNIPNLVRRRHELFGHGGSPGAPASSGQVTDPIVDGRLIEARRMLFAAREARVHPYKDDKVLTAWNGLMIVALARAGWVLDDRECADAAARAARFLLSHLRQLDAEGVRNGTVAPASAFEAAPGCERASGRLLARYRDGQAAIPAYLDDYAFLTWGLIELYGTASDPFWLEQALALNQQMLELFRDEQNGGFFFTGSDAETLSARPKEIYDGAMPSGNAVAALNLLRLARLTGDPGLDTQAESQLSALAGTVASYPAGHAFYLCALAFALDDSVEIAIAGKRDAADTNALLSVLRDSYLPVGAMVLFKPTGEEGNRELGDNRAAAYVCRHHACLAPVTDPGALIRLLS